jgi:hypothetical protein
MTVVFGISFGTGFDDGTEGITIFEAISASNQVDVVRGVSVLMHRRVPLLQNSLSLCQMAQSEGVAQVNAPSFFAPA